MSQPEKVNDSPESKFKDTLNLPRTDFPMRPDSKKDDVALLERWQSQDLYREVFEKNKGKKKFILHDGPPYANGPIHIGHAYNKILKDIVTKSQRMMGHHVPVTPGWDCHGLPIELKVSKEYPGLSPEALMRECRSHANNWIDVQKAEFKRLGVLMDWNRPYLTMDYSYEASILRAFGAFIEKGYIQKKKKTVPWCASCQTVLASAEIEYHDRKDPSIYVLFTLSADQTVRLLPDLKDKKVSFLVWTTTPWTLPLNRAVLLKPGALYDVLALSDDNYVIVGSERTDAIAAMLSLEKKVIATVDAGVFAGIKVQHPFIDGYQVPVVFDPFVSMTDGTACVHCAPGCGPQDYDVALKNNLEIYSPLTTDGRYTHDIEPAELAGMSVTDGQIWVLRKLTDRGTLLHKTSLRHSYPHCWRCRNGLIFRATSQWFCNLEQNNLRERALASLRTITFLPERTINFLKATIEGRLEWCLSRQRVWGVPIPALICTDCSHPFITPRFVELVARGVAKEGVEFWDRVKLADLRDENFDVGTITCVECNGSEFEKERDILDVWFDSGVSHFAVLEQNKELAFPADIYLEGVDQHRGWFQSSLLTSLVLSDKPPMKAIFTHGFTVDEAGRKMSKSLGNVVSPQELIDRLGTDGVRLWAASLDNDGDAVVSEALLENVSKVYRKIRNTCRFLLSNLYDYDHSTDSVSYVDLQVIDRAALQELALLNYKIKAAYQRYSFTTVFHELADYCTVELSQYYLDIIKDRLYCEKSDGPERRSAQTAVYHIVDTITRLMAPIMSFTAEHVSDFYQRDKNGSIHLESFTTLDHVWCHLTGQDYELSLLNFNGESSSEGAIEMIRRLEQIPQVNKRSEQWRCMKRVRDAVLKSIEHLRQEGTVKHSLEASLTLSWDFGNAAVRPLKELFDEIVKSGQSLEAFFKEFFIVSQCTIIEPNKASGVLDKSELDGLFVRVEPAVGVKCLRCWHYDTTNNGDGLCQRCQRVLNQ